MDRRLFLGSTLAALSAGLSGRLFAAPSRPATNGRLLVVFLRGAYDAASALVPVASDFYYASRPKLAIARPDTTDPLAALALNADWGLHPAIASPLAGLLADGQLGFVPYVGVPGASRSHFEVQDRLEAGVDGAARVGRDGMLYRLAQQIGSEGAISFSTGLPLIMKGESPLPNIALRTPRRSRLDDEQLAAMAEMYRHHALKETFDKAMALRELGAEEMAMDVEKASRGASGAGVFAREAHRIAAHMRNRFPLAFLELGGWDTHSSQGGAEGTLARLFAQLGGGLARFAEHMGDEWSRTGVLVVSEFGRTFRENGSGGTDHGHGTVFWVLGGALEGEAVRGPQWVPTEARLNEGRDYPVELDYRAIFAEASQRVFGLSATQVFSVFGVDAGKVLA